MWVSSGCPPAISLHGEPARGSSHPPLIGLASVGALALAELGWRRRWQCGMDLRPTRLSINRLSLFQS